MGLSPRVVDLGRYELLAAIADTGSIGACARHLGLSQPAVSTRIRGLEQHLGLRLLDRHPRGATLSEAGMLVLGWARPALEAAATFDQALSSLTGPTAAHLTIAASTTFAEYFLPIWFPTLKERLPGTNVSLHCLNSADTVALSPPPRRAPAPRESASRRRRVSARSRSLRRESPRYRAL